MKGLLIIVVSLYIAVSAVGQDSISHVSCKGKKSVIHRLILGVWINTKDSNEKITITNKKIKFNRGLWNNNDTNFYDYTLKYIDSSKAEYGGEVFGHWTGFYIVHPFDLGQ